MSVTRDEIEEKMDELARKFAPTHDTRFDDDIDRLSSELIG